MRPHCFAGLRVLNLKFPEPSFEFSLADFLDSFGTCMKLQQLSLIGAEMADEEDLSSANLTTRHFPSLTRISIDLQHSEQSYRLLDHITTPQDQDLHFVLHARDPTSSTDIVPPHFLSLFSRPSTSTPRQFVLSIDQIDPFEIRILVSSDQESSPKLFMAVFIIGSRLEESWVNAGRDKVSMKQSYQRLYEAFPSVERLHIKACQKYGIQALAAEATGVHPFNNLQDLEIMLRYDWCKEIAKSLLETAKARCGPSFDPIKKLILHASQSGKPFRPGDLLQLRDFAEDVYYSEAGESESENGSDDEL